MYLFVLVDELFQIYFLLLKSVENILVRWSTNNKITYK
jgi:hypothetical protein